MSVGCDPKCLDVSRPQRIVLHTHELLVILGKEFFSLYLEGKKSDNTWSRALIPLHSTTLLQGLRLATGHQRPG